MLVKEMVREQGRTDSESAEVEMECSC